MPLARPPWRWIGAAVVLDLVVLYATLGRYGYHRDELYFRMLPRGWGYVDQPFLTPLIAKLSTSVFGDTLIGLRMLAPLFLAAGIVLAALIARELGGTSRAQSYAAWGYACTPLVMLSGHYLVTATIDLTLWSAVLLASTRALLHDERWWVVTGALAGVALDNKLLIALLAVGLAVGLLVVGPRTVFASRWLWLGFVAAMVVGSPSLLYQATHDWPQLTMAGALHDDASDVRVQLLPMQVLLVGPPLFCVAVAGFVALLRRTQWRPVRAMSIAYLVALALNFVGGGQIYYAFGLLAYLLCAGWIPATERLGDRTLGTAVAVNGLVGAFVALPLLPVEHVGPQAALNPTIGDQVGWPAYVRSLTSVYDGLPADEKQRAVVFTGNYGEAGALDRYGRDLPPVFSAQNQLYFYGPPPESRDVVLAWTEDFESTAAAFGDCRRAAVLDNGVHVDNEEQGSVIAVCRLPAGGWKQLWPELQHYD